ncbi:tetratricopeptide repeat protein [Streptomyces sp. NPDC048357]|uniref:tetratricopeptide repeat protein n=1 Tax=Streptomyces sp. NPDC048357 TaxID=3154719 RepID=UPI003441F5A9
MVIQSGNATASHGGIAVTGIYSPSVHLPPGAMRPPAEVDAPAGLDDLPYRPGRFVGRDRELDRLDAALCTPGAIQAVHGLGGIGKSALAAHWAATRPHGCAPLRWITADSSTGVQRGLAGLATALQPALAQLLPAEDLAEWGLQWLASHTGWLLVLDNVNDPADVARLIARTRGGMFLITSRLSAALSGITTLTPLDVLDAAESFALLTGVIGASGPRDLDGAAELCAELGHLPLAIEQAGAYLAQNVFTTPGAYLHLLDRHPADIYRQAAVATPSERTIASVWNVTLDQITTRQPEAADLLRTLAWYAPDNIPIALADGFDDPPAQNAAIGLLAAYSMISPDPATGTLSVHRLVQALARTPDPDDPHRTPDRIERARERATDNLYTALPVTWGEPDTWPTWRTLVPHIDALADHAASGTDTATTAAVLSAAGGYLANQGLPSRAVRLSERGLAAYERVMGPDHPATLACRRCLARACEAAGDLARAILLHEQLLADSARVLGGGHPDTLRARCGLADACTTAGDLTRAIRLYEETFAGQALLVGRPDDPSLLNLLDRIAHAYRLAGDLARAIPLHEKLLPDLETMQGPDHPDTVSCRTHLAGAYMAAGDFTRAVPLFEKTLACTQGAHGPDHPSTLSSRNNLAYAYMAAGDLDRAIFLYEALLADMERVQGPEHPNTLSSYSNLASAYLSAGDVAHAIALHQRTLAMAERVLGPDHPNTLTSRNNLANAYRLAKDPAHAVPLYEQSLADSERVLGPDHPNTLVTRGNLAGAFGAAGDLTRSIRLLEQLSADCERVLGPGHPNTLTSRNNLAHAYVEAGDYIRGIPLCETTLADSVRALGPDHPNTLATRRNLACAYLAAGDRDRAVPAFLQNLSDSERVLGKDHPLTRTAAEELAYALGTGDGDTRPL